MPLTDGRRRGDRADGPRRAALGREDAGRARPASRRSAPDAAGILVEFQSPAGTDLARRAARRPQTAAATLTLLAPAEFTSDPLQQARLWKVRKGMFPAVGAVRKRGTSVIFEDIAVPTNVLAPAALDLQALFRRHRYEDGIIFGHAKDGNLHFVISQSFNDAAAIRQYEEFTVDLVEMVVDEVRRLAQGGARHRAQHGARSSRPSGAARRSRSWPALKTLVDPDGLLNPGVLVNHDPAAHLKDLKSLPEVEEEVDRCIECGFCESLCPSRDLTLTPRQRIVVRRAMEREGADVAALREAFEYDALETCATDGLCALACPVSIDTGRLTKRLRASMQSRIRAARGVAGARATSRRRNAWSARRCAARRRAGPLRRLAAGAPCRRSDRPCQPPRRRCRGPNEAGATAILFPSCVSRTHRSVARRIGRSIGARRDDRRRRARRPAAAHSAMHRPALLRHAVRIEGIPSKRRRLPPTPTIADLWTASKEGTLPVVVDTSPCAYALTSGEGLTPENRERLARMRIVDAVDYFARRSCPRCTLRNGAPAPSCCTRSARS